MTTENQKPDSDPSPSSPAPSTDAGQDMVGGYLTHVREVLTTPDAFFDSAKRSPKLFGLISLGVFLGLVFIQTLIARVTRSSNWGFDFAYLTHAIKTALAIGIPIAAVVFVLKWQAGRTGGSTSLDFYIEKFGAALILPCVLMLVAIPLDILDITIYSWFRGAALIFVYAAVFMMSYWYAAPKRLHVAVLFLLGFYFAYRLLLLLF